jgi:pentapeptide MXKDX repeat protein
VTLTAQGGGHLKTGRIIMNTRPFASAAGAILFGLCVAVGSAGAQTSTDSMSKPDAMKSDTMKKDSMKTDPMKTDSMKMGSKADCMHKAGMEKDSMKKSDMMKHCDAMK